jgi:ZIP family zinc transporter
MEDEMSIIYCLIGILLPFFATSLGSSFVFFLKNDLNSKIKKLLIGISIGVMLSSSIFSLLIPSIEMSKNKWLTPTIGIILGFVFLILINLITRKKENSSLNMMMMSVTIHNIPEGMVVGASFACVLSGISEMALMSAIMLSIGIAIQNIPEGTIISVPYKIKGNSKFKSFIMGVLSGIVEPVFALLTIILFNHSVVLLPYLLSFASGAMIYVIIDELVPEMNEEKNFSGIVGVLIGFIIMMILDISFG